MKSSYTEIHQQPDVYALTIPLIRDEIAASKGLLMLRLQGYLMLTAMWSIAPYFGEVYDFNANEFQCYYGLQISLPIQT